MGDQLGNYFTCTLGQASAWNRHHGQPYSTIRDLVDIQAAANSDSLAVAFPRLAQDHGSYQLSYGRQYCFKDIRDITRLVAAALNKTLNNDAVARRPSAIGLLSASSPTSLFAWLGLEYLGHPVLLLEPQLELSAVKHLCQSCCANVILVDEQNRQKVESIGGLKVICISSILQGLERNGSDQHVHRPIPASSSDVAHIFHTSGTSSGVPKPISQTQRGAVGVLPCLSDTASAVTFSTTPLYHAGISDCLRAWSSGAMIWLFPEGRIPITAASISYCLDFADREGPSAVAYFSSVPYILEFMVEDAVCLERLRKMRLVGVGGSALAECTGNMLVESGVNLVSRFGSAECGFIMSSERDFSRDRDWQYLRRRQCDDSFSFEPSPDRLSELVIGPKWPHVMKTNRDDGSYATSDLFEPHPTIPDAWRYNSRLDAVLALSNGKKFDPTPAEIVLSSSPHLRDAYIFGSGRDCTGCILFPSRMKVAEELVEAVRPLIGECNRRLPSFARLSSDMLIVIDTGSEEPLVKSSKGTVVRNKADIRYWREIEAAYRTSNNQGAKLGRTVTGQDVPALVEDIFKQTLGRHLDPDLDLFHQGVDSTACTVLRSRLEATFVANGEKFPKNIVYDLGSVNAIVRYILGTNQGRVSFEETADEAELALMQDLVRTYSVFPDSSVPHQESRRGQREIVVLSGASGFLGSHLLHLLLKDGKVDKIYCPVRSGSIPEAVEKVRWSLLRRGLTDLDTQSAGSRLVCFPIQAPVSDPGPTKERWAQLQREATTFIHGAWAVNFNLRLKSYIEQIRDLRDTLTLARNSGSRFFFISSTASVLSSSSSPISETLSTAPESSAPLGYARSKWVAEMVCAAAQASKSPDHANESLHPTQLADVSILRLGQLCANTKGIWNASEAYPLMLSTAKLCGRLPLLPEEYLNWLPVDTAAQIILEIVHFNGPEIQKGTRIETKSTGRSVEVYHVLNSHRTPSWSQMLGWIQDHVVAADKGSLDIVPFREWILALESVLRSPQDDRTSDVAVQRVMALIPLWKNNHMAPTDSARPRDSSKPVLEASRTTSVSPVLKELEPLKREDILTMWDWVQSGCIDEA